MNPLQKPDCSNLQSVPIIIVLTNLIIIIKVAFLCWHEHDACASGDKTSHIMNYLIRKKQNITLSKVVYNLLVALHRNAC
jgi:hypothetical protein